MKRSDLLAAAAIALGLAGGSAAPIWAAGDRIVIGVLGDHSSAYADIGGPKLVEAVKMAAEEAGGEVGGRKIEVIWADSQLKPDVAASITRKWFEADGVDVVVDLPSTAMALSVGQLAEEFDKVALLTSAGGSNLTNKDCRPNSVHWTYDTYGIAHSIGRALAESGKKKWFFITADYAFGTQLENDATAVLKETGGEVVGSVRAPLNTVDFSSFLLQAQASGADVIALANAGSDAVNAIKQANEFGLGQAGQQVAAMVLMDNDIKSIGLELAQNIRYATAFDWTLTEESRAFADAFRARTGTNPNMNMAGSYSAVKHYLKAVDKAGTVEAGPVLQAMRDLPVHDAFTPNGTLRIDGRMVHDMYLMRVKSPTESQSAWDLATMETVVPGDVAFRSLAESECPLVKK
ncbi:ABC transporter permease [Haematobacter missouriensis]|uniref:ABC transporter permease n=1 Tax=Haematobacter missouriensis TaxID=366616 RepID=A0A212AQM2_9RHOB|nr:ABC transporter substrate-binding protein [Haematobacter missouriensis]KFI25863.1 ABC transporter permease [Haematobacter missouriensis]OWJ77087.1 ABC transporter permease [Haematobacter missouriensis]OWJ83743.1 ABC transporter permease [Haematobacter missouriensis]